MAISDYNGVAPVQSTQRLTFDPKSSSLSKSQKNSVAIILFSFVFGSIFGLRLSDDFSVSLSLVSLYLTPIILLANGSARLNFVNLFMYIFAICLVTLSFFVEQSFGVSINSFFYLVVMYAPFCVVLKSRYKTDVLYEFAMETFLKYTLALAILAIFQFFLQFVIRSPWVGNITILFPQSIIAAGEWNTAIDSGGGVFKANGFFQLEPSSLSLWLGVAILTGTVTKRLSRLRLAIHALALILSFSGTGMLVLAIALIMPARLNTLIRTLLVCFGGWLALQLVDGLLFSSYFSNRLSEFTTPGTSGYARFVAPLEIVRYGMRTIANMLLGNGPGTYRPAVVAYPHIWEIHDPTWAKLLYEYGVMGGGMFFLFVAISIVKSNAPRELKVGLVYAWLASGGQLLTPTFCAAIYSLAVIWPARHHAKVGRNRRGKLIS